MSPKFRVFDPAMCCSTGVCGPSVDPALARFAADIAWLQRQGVSVERFNLGVDPGAFVTNPAVKEALTRGNDVLPIVMVDDRIVSEGAYPERETLAAMAGIVIQKVPLTAQGTCRPSPDGKSGCC